MTRIADLDTPAALVDVARMQRNIDRLQQRTDALGVRFRPHVKTTKCLPVVRAQLEAGARGITVSTLKEAEQFFAAGIADILYAVGMVPAKLPHALAFNAPVLPNEMARLADALGVPGDDPAGALWDLAVASNVPTRLADLSGSDGPLQADQLPGAADAAAAEITVNPRPVDRDDLLGILERAFAGERPVTA